MRIDLSPDAVCPLDKQHQRSSFDCGNAALNRYLRQQARQEMQRHVSVTFVLPSPYQAAIGFYTLSSCCIALRDLPVFLAQKLPRYAHLPATLLARLAIDQSAQAKGIGQFLLLDALRRSWEHAQVIGAMAVVVDAKNSQAEQFYRHFGFQPLQAAQSSHNCSRLFLPMQHIATVLNPL